VANTLSWLAREHETQWAGEEGDVQVYWKLGEILRNRVLKLVATKIAFLCPPLIFSG